MRSPRMIARLAICCLLVALAVSPLFAQIPQRSDTTNTPVPGVGHNYVTSPIDTVNPANGALSIRIGVKMPSARGIQLPFDFAYDSNGTAYVKGSGGLTLGFASVTTPFSQGGWSYAVPTMSVGKTTWTYTDIGDKQHTCTAAISYVFQDPSGGRHDLDMSIWNGLADCANFPMNNGNLVQTVTQGGEGSILSTTTSPLLATGIVNPVSVTDGDGNLFSFPQASLGNNTVYPPTSITDRNGNYISLPSTISFPFTYTDTVGRTALSISGLGGSPDTISVAGLAVPYTVHWTTITPTFTATLTNLEPPPSCTLSNSHGPVKVVSSISLPDGQQYTFSYDSVYGMVNKITLPNGGYIRYVWGLNTQSAAGEFNVYQPPTWPQGSICAARYDTAAVTDRYISYNGTTEVEHQHFSYSTTWSTSDPTEWTAKTSTETTYDLLRGTNFNTISTYAPLATDIAPNTTEYPTGQIPLDIIVQHYSTGGTLLRTEYKSWGDERVQASLTTILDSGQSSQTNHFYNGSEQEIERDDYDYGTGTVPPPTLIGPPPTPMGALLRKVVTAYAPLGGHVVDKPSSVITDNGAGTRLAETDYAYDQTTPTATTGVVHLTTGQNIGNVTTKTDWLNTGTSPVTTYAYDNTGQILKKTDPVTTPCPSGCITTYSYTDSYTIGTPPGNTNAYLTTLTHPTTSGVAHVEKFKYSYTDGNPTQFIDQNNQTSTYKFVDNFDRLTEIDYPDTGKTLVTYMDSGSSPTITISKAMTSTQSLTNVSVMDGVGQPVQAKLTTDPAGTDYTDSTFDGLGLLWKKSNPHRTGSSPTDGTTTYAYDALKRTVSVTDPDTNVVSTSYAGNCSTVTDEVSKSRKSCNDALGRMTQVFEDPAGLNYETDYTYDALGNLTNVVQKGGTSNSTLWRNRSFVFDSLSRLTQTNNPETGTTNYTYDAVDNLLTKTDARSIVTTFTYDALYRATQKSYSDGVTPTANFVFDQCPSGGCPTGITPLYPIDRLVKSYTASAQSYYNYDSMGRIATHWQCTPVNCGTSFFNLGYTYDQIGDQTVVSYNGSFTATTTYNGAADPTALTSSLSDSQHPANLASAINYGPTGQPTALSYGNGLVETLSYNNRLQPQQLSTINSTTLANVLSMTLSFVDPVSGHNNGNLISMSATGAQVISGRSYTYDSLNRLTTMSAPGDSSACTGLSWTYDAWGNRSAQTVTGGSCPDAFTTTFTQNNNRMDSYSYDAAGNLLGDGTHTYTYDGEGRTLKVDGGSTATYVYDAEGRRIEKIKGPAQTHYWYGTDGQVRAESNQSGSLQNDYLYLGGKMLAQYTSTTTMFAHLDHLGSTRLVTAVNGSTAECDDYLPFGEQLSYSGTHPCSNTADTTHKFTGQERDTETNLDKFEARYFSSTMGRFMIPDWDAKPVTVPYAHFGNPQSLNLYVYVSNNPLTFADPDGHDTGDDKPHAAPGAGCQDNMDCESKAGQTGSAPDNKTKPPQPKNPDGSPKVPPVPVPGAPGMGWKWNPDSGNPRGGTYGGDGWKGPNPPNASLDPDGHWDVNDGSGNPVQHYDPNGKPITPEQAHPGNPPASKKQSIWDRTKSIAPGPIVRAGTAAIVVFFVVSEGSRLFPPRNLVPIP